MVALKPHQFQPGNPGGGRPKGARNKLSETALAALSEHFAEHGMDAIDRVYRERPAVYLQCVCSLLPKMQITEKLGPFTDLTDDELNELERHHTAIRAKLVKAIEG
jgi:hypothetical protein